MTSSTRSFARRSGAEGYLVDQGLIPLPARGNSGADRDGRAVTQAAFCPQPAPGLLKDQRIAARAMPPQPISLITCSFTLCQRSRCSSSIRLLISAKAECLLHVGCVVQLAEPRQVERPGIAVCRLVAQQLVEAPGDILQRSPVGQQHLATDAVYLLCRIVPALPLARRRDQVAMARAIGQCDADRSGNCLCRIPMPRRQ